MAQTLKMLKKSDVQIQRDVLKELNGDERVLGTEVGVEVRSGIVTLTGTVDSWKGRLAAQQDAHRVPGVLDVANDIQVKLAGSYGRSDSDIAQGIRHTLEWDVRIPHERIQTTVSNGVVTLEGSVVALALRRLPGVREVINLITVESRPASSSRPMTKHRLS
jgi:osmotically-inducible protein OsmY